MKRERFRRFVDMVALFYCAFLIGLFFVMIWGGEKLGLSSFLSIVFVTLLAGALLQERFVLLERWKLSMIIIYLILSILVNVLARAGAS